MLFRGRGENKAAQRNIGRAGQKRETELKQPRLHIVMSDSCVRSSRSIMEAYLRALRRDKRVYGERLHCVLVYPPKPSHRIVHVHERPLLIGDGHGYVAQPEDVGVVHHTHSCARRSLLRPVAAPVRAAGVTAPGVPTVGAARVATERTVCREPAAVGGGARQYVSPAAVTARPRVPVFFNAGARAPGAFGGPPGRSRCGTPPERSRFLRCYAAGGAAALLIEESVHLLPVVAVAVAVAAAAMAAAAAPAAAAALAAAAAAAAVASRAARAAVKSVGCLCFAALTRVRSPGSIRFLRPFNFVAASHAAVAGSSGAAGGGGVGRVLASAGSGAELCLHLVAPRTVLQVADVALAVYEHVQLGGGVAGGEFRLVQHPLFVRNGQRSNR